MSARSGCQRAAAMDAAAPNESVDSANSTASPSPAATNDDAVPTSESDVASATTRVLALSVVVAAAAALEVAPIDHGVGTTESTDAAARQPMSGAAERRRLRA